MAEFLDMGGYAFFVWTSYALTAIVLFANWLLPIIEERQVKRSIAKKLLREKGESHASGT